VAKLRLQDSSPDGNQWCLHVDEKGGKARTIPARYDLQTYVEVYLVAAGSAGDPGEAPLFRSAVRKTKVLTPLPMSANAIYRMVKHRLRVAGAAALLPLVPGDDHQFIDPGRNAGGWAVSSRPCRPAHHAPL